MRGDPLEAHSQVYKHREWQQRQGLAEIIPQCSEGRGYVKKKKKGGGGGKKRQS